MTVAYFHCTIFEAADFSFSNIFWWRSEFVNVYLNSISEWEGTIVLFWMYVVENFSKEINLRNVA